MVKGFEGGGRLPRKARTPAFAGHGNDGEKVHSVPLIRPLPGKTNVPPSWPDRAAPWHASPPTVYFFAGGAILIAFVGPRSFSDFALFHIAF